MLFLVSVALCACSIGRRTTSESTSDEEFTSSTSLSVHSDEDEAALARGKQASAEGRYDDAVTIFDRLHDDPSARAEFRAAALLELGKVDTNLLNPRRDEEKARAHFQMLIDEFPDSVHKAEAEERLARLQPSNSRE